VNGKKDFLVVLMVSCLICHS